MKIAIISDTHDNLANLKKALSFIRKEKIKILIHCGDIFKPDTITETLGCFKGETHLIFSKADASFSKIPEDSFKDISRTKTYSEFGELIVDEKKIAFSHFPEIAKALASSQKYDLVFYGHTHRPWEEKLGRTRLINPGNIAGLFYKATFAIYNTKTDKLELKILERFK